MSNSQFIIQDDKKTLTVTRTFKAKKSAVWSAYTEADKLSQWWGPKGWETEVKEIDLSPGGSWLYCMICKDKEQGEWFGQSSCGKGVYDAINPEDLLSYTDYFTDDQGNIDAAMPASKTTLEFVEEEGRTTITSTTEFESEDALKQVMEMGMEQGFDQTWDNLERFLAQYDH